MIYDPRFHKHEEKERITSILKSFKKQSLESYFIKIHPNAKIPEYKSYGAVGLDLYNLEDFIIYPNEQKLVSTGLIVKPPQGFYWELHLRSSTPKNYPGLNLANNIGIIDPDYCGPTDEIKLLLINNALIPYNIKKDIRIVQMILRPHIKIIIKELLYEEIQNGRSRGGFGSTQ